MFSANLKIESNATVSSNLDLTGAIIYHNGNIAAKHQFWHPSFATNALNVGGADPIRAVGIRVFATDALADADATLYSGSFYKLVGSRGVFQKP